MNSCEGRVRGPTGFGDVQSANCLLKERSKTTVFYYGPIVQFILAFPEAQEAAWVSHVAASGVTS